MRDLLLVATVAVCAVIAIGRPTFGMFVFICLGFLNPHSFTWGLGRTIGLSQLVAVGTIVGFLLSSQPKRVPLHRETLLLIALWATFGISTLLVLDQAFAHFILVSKILLMVFLSTALINTDRKLQVLIRIIVLSLGFYALKGGLFFFMSGGNETVWGPEDSFLYANNSIGLALAMNVPLLVYLWKTEPKSRLRWVIGAMLVLSFPATLATFSRGAWMGLAVATAVLALRGKYKRLLISTILLLSLVAVPLLERLLPERAIDRYDLLVNYQEDASAQSRLWNWEFCQRVAVANPIVGAGFDFYSLDAYRLYYPEFLDRWPGKVWACHSMWLTIAAEHGLLSLLLWISLLLSCLFSLREVRRHGRQHPDVAWLVHLADGIQASLLAFMVVGTFLDVSYFDMFYYLVGCVVVAKEGIRRAPESVRVVRKASDERAGV